MGAFLSLAASSAATTVEDEVTFCARVSPVHQHSEARASYNSGNGKLLLLSITEELSYLASQYGFSASQCLSIRIQSSFTMVSSHERIDPL